MVDYRKKCIECETSIDATIFNYSTEQYGHPMCRDCQDWYQGILVYSTATDEAIDLYFALKKRGVPAQLEKNDGFKTIDIAVPDAKVNIEVDGQHHNFNPKQAMSDLKRTYHSFKEGYLTLRIPNSLAKYHLEDAAELITEFLIESRDRNGSVGNNEPVRHLGFCIRCSDKLELNLDKPFCSTCYNEWSAYKNYNYQENNCHCCGNKNKTSMSKPVCYNCYKIISEN
jgi:hypothetical protein